MRAILCLMVLEIFCLGLPVFGAEPLARAVVYSPHAAEFTCQLNMGPTGARAWMRGYHLVVMSIDQGSPAHGSLLPADVVIGVAGTMFGPDADPRITLGNAIGEAETTGKPLPLTVLRRGKEQKVEIPLPRLGAFADTWPAKCEKSDRILAAACQSLLNAQMPDGQVTTDDNTGTFLAGLALLSTGDPVYLDGARRAAHHSSDFDYNKLGYGNWGMGYGGVLLAEYYLATGDDSVLGKLQWLADGIAKGQMQCGSWGHNSPAGGYGALNQVGLPCAMALQMATECGIKVDQAALKKSLDFFGRYAELGSIPYGDHRPGNSPDDNGKNSVAAILMHLAGRDHEAQVFSRTVASSYWLREEGHTGGYFSLMWGPLAAAMAPAGEYRTFLDYQRWYYNLCRTWKGELVLLPYHEALTRFDNSGYIYGGGDFSTGGMALAFAQPRRHLRILGAPTSVFSSTAKLTGFLATARDHYLKREWLECDKALQVVKPADEDERRWRDQLLAARKLAKASIDRTLLEIESNLTEGDHNRADRQLVALKRCYGATADSRFAAVEKVLAEGPLAWQARDSRQYYESWQAWNGFAVRSWVAQGPEAKHRQWGIPSLRPPIWEPLSPVSSITAQSWRSFTVPEGGKLPDDWMNADFDDKSWALSDGIAASNSKLAIAARRQFTVVDPTGANLRVRLQTVRPARTKVYLNGVLIVDAVRGQRGDYASIKLDPSVFGILRRGENVLAVTCDQQGTAGNRLDVGLEINRVNIEQRVLPPVLAEMVYTDDRPEGDETLRVRETKEKFQLALQESYNQKSIPDLLKGLEDPLPYTRYMVTNALLAKGPPGITAAFGLSEHKDWKVRSAVAGIVLQAGRATKGKLDSDQQALFKVQVPALTRLVADEHFWVRTRAIESLAMLGDDAAVALPELVKRVQDPSEWVRASVIRAVQKLGKDPQVMVKAAEQSLMMPNSAYDGPDAAVAILKKNASADESRLKVLLALLKNPPEGGGGALLGEVMAMAVELDPAGTQVIPVLIEAAEGKSAFGRFRGNPRGKAIETLGQYGPKAIAAVPILEAILASDAKNDKPLQKTTQSALASIRGESAH